MKAHQVQIKQTEEKQKAKSTWQSFKSKYKGANESEINYKLTNDEVKKVKSEAQTSEQSAKTIKILKASIAFFLIWNILHYLVGEVFMCYFGPILRVL